MLMNSINNLKNNYASNEVNQSTLVEYESLVKLT